MARFGQLYSDVVLAPLAEQLATAAGIAPGETVVDVLCDSGALSAEAARRAGGGGVIHAVDTENDNLDSARTAVAGESVVHLHHSDGRHIALPTDSCDHAICLLTLGYGDVPALIDDMRRVTRPTGGISILTFGGGNAVHERILIEAIASVTGRTPAHAQPLLAADPRATGLHATRLRDVVRFDGAHQYWDALLDQRGILDRLSAAEGIAVRGHVEAALEVFAAADGTLRIPIDVLLLSS